MQNTENKPSPSLAPLAGLTVLLVEDEPDIAELFTFILEEYGAEVILARSALEALGELGQRRPDILVSNVRLPQEDGRWLIEQIRQLEGTWGELPAIAVTSYTRESNAENALEAGFQHFMSKPLDADELVQEILKLVGRQ
ncbi:response regulator [Leptolyngbya sp. FACHB-671]|uniref:response regulator n=1 Tax=Leptolyngbya sp. FACHB-671 TaxID=2692812 RepID=UPI00168641CC|nr:response regulator [Leptolyngbya sp. FACHB-671]MBD2066169.1 response regulator [Leptolyngbya sp. FACHB-671]